MTHWIPPPERALSAVGGGAVTPGPAACTGVAGAGSVVDGDGPAVAVVDEVGCDVTGAGLAEALVGGASKWLTVAWISGRLT